MSYGRRFHVLNSRSLDSGKGYLRGAHSPMIRFYDNTEHSMYGLSESRSREKFFVHDRKTTTVAPW